MLMELSVQELCSDIGMTKSSKYRVVAAIVASVFLVFNVGLPIVVASCPMTTTNSVKPAGCSMCPPASNATSQRLARVINTSCCSTVIAADKNGTEFVRVNYGSYEPIKFVATTVTPLQIESLSYHASVFREDHPLFLPIDIPIFTSSLLI